jgi:hypothetical protein
MLKTRLTPSKAEAVRVHSSSVGFFALSLSCLAGISGSGLSARADENVVTPRSTVKACGSLSYDTQGGSLVINNSAPVEVTDRSLEGKLVDRAMQGPFDACLIGNWVDAPAGRKFSASAVE